MQNNQRRARTLLLGFFIFLLLSSVRPLGLIEPRNVTDQGFSPTGDIVHIPISINGDDEFANQAFIEGWPGNGLAGNPYRIENLSIDASTAHGIVLTNTQVHFIISNCTIFGGDSSGYHGIVLSAVSNGIIRENELDDNENGIDLLNSASNTIEDNTVNECGNGIHLQNSDVNNVYRNTVSNSSDDGIRFRWCDDSVVVNNTCISNNVGMHIERGERDTIHNNTISDSDEFDLQIGDLCRWHTVTNNTCLTSGVRNIRMVEAANATFSHNRMYGLGMDIDVQFSWWARLAVFTDNTVNGTPILWVQDQIGGVVTGSYAQVILANCRDVILKDMFIQDTYRGVSVLFCNDTIVKNVVCFSCYYGMEVIGGQRVTVTDCTIANSVYRGFGIGWGDWPSLEELPENHLVTNCSITHSVYLGMMIGGNGGSTIFNNTVHSNGWGYNEEHQIYVFANDDMTIANNTVWGTWGGSSSIYCATPNSVIANNTCTNSDGFGIEVSGDGSEVTNNYCYRTSWAISMGGSNTNVTDNMCIETGLGIAIGGTSTDNIIAFNNCSDGGWAGIYLFGGGASDNLVLRNECKNNSGVGIYLWDLETVNTIANNTCANNTDEGIYFWRCEWTLITNNTVAYNSLGISLDAESYNNSIYWNEFHDNTGNAVDNGEDNYISNNYWSDYGGVDGNFDGIGDTPHPIPGTATNEDPYPWMGPGVAPIPSAWVVAPQDQYVEYGDDLSYDLDTMGPPSIYTWISDSTHFSIDSSLVITNVGPLAVGTYEIRVLSRNMYAHHLFGLFEVIVEDTTAPTWIQTPTDQFVEYTDSFFYDLNATDLSGLPTYWVNDTDRFSVNTQGHVTQNVDLPVGVYGLELRATDIYDNYVSTDITITVTDSTAPEIDHPDDLEFYETEGEHIYWHPTDDNPASFQILLDGTEYYSYEWTGDFLDISWYCDGPSLGVGVHNFTLVVTDAGGNSVSDTVIVTVLSEEITETTTTTTTTTTTGPDGGFEIPMTVVLLGGLGVVIIVIVVVIKRR